MAQNQSWQSTPGRRQLIPIVVAAFLLAAVFCIWGLISGDVVSYQGHTMRYWLLLANDTAGGAELSERRREARHALLIIGTNSLDLLVHRIAYDPEKSLAARLRRAPQRKAVPDAIHRFLAKDEARRTQEAVDAYECFTFLGPLGGGCKLIRVSG